MRDAPLQIGLLTHSVNPRGGVVHTLELAHALHDAGHEVTVMAPASPGQRFFRPVRCATRLIPVDAAPRDMVAMVGSRIEAFTASIGALLETARFDVLHTHDPIGGNALANLVDAGRIEGFVRTVHHLEVFDDMQLMRWQSRGFQAARQVFCVSRLWQRVLAEDHGVGACEVRNGLQHGRFSPLRQATDAALAQRLGVRTGAPVVLALGGVEARKNTVRLLQAFVLLRARWPEAQLVIAGGASLLDHAAYAREFAALAQASGLAIGPGAAIVRTGALPDEDIPSLYRLADVVAMPSLNEGFGLVTLEALASGVPIVVSRIAPFTEYLGEADAQWADPLHSASIAEALQAALTSRSPARTAAMAASAARLGATFSWAASAARHVQLYREGLHGSAAAAARSIPC
ncbi:MULTISPECIES: MSMEG_0565 family glycosyltransferase [unclassified Variovorax]|uniref:MSMEG_0565 family glycosyltransferase n=1 Tax=unclassified Variovorax TaxID=663243 RepID=UPI0025776F8C|nr:MULTISPECIES: MSMEG_0565 family glycosyltransferase [unclassified Variovorax]MDM0088593.1 MSMEG_0565 family glycosyltransferase [Variovorax sp. J22G40]MDM0146666.1 MSMEG_0565 family glycosyltransferase [Variovorax sp. J2P1-31]